MMRRWDGHRPWDQPGRRIGRTELRGLPLCPEVSPLLCGRMPALTIAHLLLAPPSLGETRAAQSAGLRRGGHYRPPNCEARHGNGRRGAPSGSRDRVRVLLRRLHCVLQSQQLELHYESYFGGVAALTPGQYMIINGFPSNHWGHGVDDEIAKRTRNEGMRIYRPPASAGRDSRTRARSVDSARRTRTGLAFPSDSGEQNLQTTAWIVRGIESGLLVHCVRIAAWDWTILAAFETRKASLAVALVVIICARTP
ncbi:unnamed protein product [Lampetra planeri]